MRRWFLKSNFSAWETAEAKLEDLSNFWRKCSSCKKPIGFRTKYWVCNVSTCNRKRTGLVFCSVSCWDAHVPMMNHRDSWAEERISPSAVEWTREQESENTSASSVQYERPARQPSPTSKTSTTHTEGEMENETAQPDSEGREVLVVASKLKNYIRTKSGMNTSASVMDALSERIRHLCDQAIDHARQDGRKTVMDRDFV